MVTERASTSTAPVASSSFSVPGGQRNTRAMLLRLAPLRIQACEARVEDDAISARPQGRCQTENIELIRSLQGNRIDVRDGGRKRLALLQHDGGAFHPHRKAHSGR